MKKLFAFFILSVVYSISNAQVPFATYGRPSSSKAESKYFRKYGMPVTAVNDIRIQALESEKYAVSSSNTMTMAEANERKKTLEKSIESLYADNKRLKESLVDDELGKPDFLDHMNANIITLQNGKKMFPTINGEVINYKLNLWTTYKTKGKDTVVRHYLPISLITKVSGNYSDSAAGPSDDATSYFGAPLTLRFSPAFELLPGKLRENKLFVGFNTDMRLLTIGDTIKNKFQTTWGVYGSAGISYLGRGYAYDGEEDTDEAGRHEGKWSFTAMVYFFKSGGDYNKAIFGNYEKKTLTGVELLLRFKTSKKEDSKFNFLIGASNCFTKGAANSGGWQFRLGIGN